MNAWSLKSKILFLIFPSFGSQSVIRNQRVEIIRGHMWAWALMVADALHEGLTWKTICVSSKKFQVYYPKITCNLGLSELKHTLIRTKVSKKMVFQEQEINKVEASLLPLKQVKQFQGSQRWTWKEQNFQLCFFRESFQFWWNVSELCASWGNREADSGEVQTSHETALWSKKSLRRARLLDSDLWSLILVWYFWSEFYFMPVTVTVRDLF
jgi:hypothetical protein